jgi:hypothetical protein
MPAAAAAKRATVPRLNVSIVTKEEREIAGPCSATRDAWDGITLADQLLRRAAR